MKALYNIGLLLCAAVALTACDNDMDPLLDKPTSGNAAEESVAEGYFPCYVLSSTRGLVIRHPCGGKW